jgi:predicted N-acetyltransferase YhbS
MAFRVRGLQRGEIDDLLACFQAAFGVDAASISVVRNSIVNDPYFHPERIRVGLLDGQVVSHAVILHRAAWVGGHTITVAGVGAVATHPTWQRRGYGGRVMADAVRLIRQQGYDLAMLTTRIPGFFARFGFREVPKINGYECPAGPLARLPPQERWSVDPIEYPRDWRSLGGVYAQYSQGRTGMQVRDARFWESWPRRGTFPLGFSSRLGALGFKAADGDSIVAYAAAGIPSEEPHLAVTDVAHLPGSEEAGLAAIQQAARRYTSGGSGRVVIRLGGDAPVLDLLRQRGIPLEVESGPGLMVLIPNRDWLRSAGLRRVDDAIERLFRSSPPILWHRDGY